MAASLDDVVVVECEYLKEQLNMLRGHTPTIKDLKNI